MNVTPKFYHQFHHSRTFLIALLQMADTQDILVRSTSLSKTQTWSCSCCQLADWLLRDIKVHLGYVKLSDGLV